MKASKFIITVVFMTIIFAGIVSADVGQTISTGIGRGFINLVTCPAEIAHYEVYDTSDIGFPGIFTGLAKGIMFTTGRAFGGISDLLTLGFIPEQSSLYKQLNLKYYVWDEKWLPEKK